MIGQVRRGIHWAAVFAALVCVAYAFGQQKLLQEDVWTHTGLKRFAIFALCYVLFFAAFSLWKPGLFPAAAGVLSLLYSFAAAGPVALLTVALVLLSSLALGQAILARRRPFETDSATGGILAILLGLSTYMFVLSVAAHAPINYAWVYLAVLAIPLIWNWRTAALCLERIPALGRPLHLSRMEQLAFAALVFVLLLHWLVALQPEVGPDALAVHLAIPASMAWSHQWSFDVLQHLWAVMPMGADWCFTLCYMLGGEPAARLFNLALLVCIVALLVSAIRKWLPLAPALLMVALFAATPLVQLVTGSLFAENLWGLLCLGALVSIDLYRDCDDPRYLYLAYALIGAGAATKFGALVFLAPLALISFWTMRNKHAPLTRLRQASIAFLCLAAFAAPPYVSAFAKTGSPVFPYLSAIFPSRYSVPAGTGTPLPGPHLSLTSPFDLTFHTSRFHEVQDGAVGFQYFLFLPLGVLLLRRNWPDLALMSGLSLVLFASLTLAVEQDVRYLYPALPLATLFMAASIGVLQVVDRGLYRFVIAIAAAVFFVDLYFLPSSNWMHKDFVSNPASGRARSEYVTAYAPERNLVDYLNEAHPGAPVAFFSERNAIAGLHGPALTASWHNIEFYNRVRTAGSPAGCLGLLQSYGVHLVVAPVPESGILVETTPIEAFLKHCTEREYRSGNFYAGRLKDRCASGWDQPGPSAPPGEYDDLDARILYTGLWARGLFGDAAHGTLTYSRSPGARLGFPFTGAEVLYVYAKAFNGGIAEIVLDGASQGSLNQYSPRVEWKSTFPIRAKGAGAHTLEIRVTGRKDTAATDSSINVEGLIVR
jgi:hypothetical protein